MGAKTDILRAIYASQLRTGRKPTKILCNKATIAELAWPEKADDADLAGPIAFSGIPVQVAAIDGFVLITPAVAARTKGKT